MTLRAFVIACACAALIGCAGRSLQPSSASVVPSAASRTHAVTRAKTLIVGSFTRPSALFTVPATANGTVDPERSIVIKNVLHFVKTQAIAYDPTLHRVWMSSCIALGGKFAPILAFDLDKPGDEPAAKIQGPTTTLGNCVTGIVLDSNANLYLSNFVAEETLGGDIPIFAPNQSGDVAPERSIHGAAPNLRAPAGLAIDAEGRLYATNTCFAFLHCPGTGVTVYAKNAGGDVAPLFEIPGGETTGIAVPEGVAFDRAGNLYVADDAGRIEVFAPGAHGAVKPIRIIESRAFCRPTGIAVDEEGYVYVGNQCEEPNWPVLVFAPDAHGLVNPVQTISIKSQETVVPSGIALEY